MQIATNKGTRLLIDGLDIQNISNLVVTINLDMVEINLTIFATPEQFKTNKGEQNE